MIGRARGTTIKFASVSKGRFGTYVPRDFIHMSTGVVYASPGVVNMPPCVLRSYGPHETNRQHDHLDVAGAGVAEGKGIGTHWYSGSSESKSTHSTPTRSRLSSTIDALSWSVASSSPRKSAPPVFGAGIFYDIASVLGMRCDVMV